MAKKQDPKQPPKEPSKAELDRRAKLEEKMKGMGAAARARLLAGVVAAKEFGEDSVTTADHLDDNLTYITMPDLLMQAQLSRPGYAGGRIQSIIGYEGVSKTSKMYWQAGIIAQPIYGDLGNEPGLVHIVALEKADSTEHIRNYVDPSQVVIWQANTLEEGILMSYEIQRIFKESDPDNKLPKMQGFDSVAGATMEALLSEDQEAGAKTPGGIGKIMADFVNTMKEKIAETDTLWTVINQARDKQAMNRMDAMALQWAPQIEKLTAKGGRALPFASTYFEVLDKSGRLKDDDKLVSGFRAKCTWRKNKLGKPEKSVEYEIEWGKNFDFIDNTIEVLSVGGTLGLRMEGKKCWCPEIGVTEKSKLSVQEIYAVMHLPENMAKFRTALGVFPGKEYAPFGRPRIMTALSGPSDEPAARKKGSAVPPPPSPIGAPEPVSAV